MYVEMVAMLPNSVKETCPECESGWVWTMGGYERCTRCPKETLWSVYMWVDDKLTHFAVLYDWKWPDFYHLAYNIAKEALGIETEIFCQKLFCFDAGCCWDWMTFHTQKKGA